MQKFIILIIFIFSISVNAQITFNGPAEGFVSNGITLNTNDFSFNNFSYQEFNLLNEFEPESDYQHFMFSDLSYPERNFYYLHSNSNSLSDSLIISQNFEGIPQTNYFPPDDYIAAGPNHLVMVVNNLFRIYDKSGNIQKTINAADWYSTLFNGAAPVDPKILYDPFDNRWVMVWLSVDFVQFRSFYIISVSDDDDPNGVWFNWALPSDVNGNTPSNNWGDYEGVGFDDAAIYLTSNQFSFSSVYDYVKIRIIDKDDIYINSSPGIVRWKDIWNITLPDNSYSAFGLRPARMYNTSNEFYLFYLPYAGGNICAVYKIENAVTNPVLTGTGYPITAFEIAPDARQLGGNLRIYGGSSALKNEPVYQDGILHVVHSIRNPNDTSLSSLHYLKIDPVNNIVRKDIAMGDDEHFFFFPALAVDKNNNVIISYSRSSANEYAGGFFTLIPGHSGVPTSSIKLKEGNAYYDKRNSAGRNRWGDYSGAWIDPVDSMSFWICTEYVEALNTWGTWIGEIKYDNVIPVELVSFDAKAENENIVLNWEVSSEINNYGYIINRGIRADSTYQIGFVEGNGTTTEKQFYSFIHKEVNNGLYHYQLVQVDYDGSEYIIAQLVISMNGVPNTFSLSQNYPNPFNPATTISYSLPIKSQVELVIYNTLGESVTQLVNEEKEAGKYSVKFSATGGSAGGGNAYTLPSGIYFYRLQALPTGRQAGSFVETKKMVLLK